MVQSRILGAAMLCAALLTPAIAEAATATANVNVRSAPRTGAVVDVLGAGEQVEIDRCSAGWCYVVKSGPDGWVSASYLSNDDDDEDYDDDSSPSRPDVDVSIGFSVPGFSFQIGNGGFDIRPGRPGRPGTSDRVCFFDRTNYNGASFCVRPGERISSLGSWNDRIESIDVRGDAQALVCEDNSFRGRCVVVSRDIRDLGRAGRNEISSIRVR